MLGSDHCPALRNAPFIWVGCSDILPPYRMVRLRSVHSHVVVSVSGAGRALVDGRMVDWPPGRVFLAPVGLHHAFESRGPGPWRIAWVFFDDTESAPSIFSDAVTLRRADTGDFVALLDMLLREAAGGAKPFVMESLVLLLGASARRLAGSDTLDARLRRVWEKVEADLGRDWCASDLAGLGCVSEEHFRRLCHKHYQRSPISQLTQLRLRRAATLLRSTSMRVDEVARQTGYGSVYSFSAAFRRWSGIPPARFRRMSV